MALDRLKEETAGYVKDKQELEKKFDELYEAIGKVSRMYGSNGDLDSEVQQAIDNIMAEYKSEEAGLKDEESELKKNRDKIMENIREEKEKVDKTNEILDSIKGQRYGSKAENAQASARKALADLKQMITDLGLSDLGSSGSSGEAHKANSRVNIDGNYYKTDDSGQVHMKRDANGNYQVLPNMTYTSYGYTYRTDTAGRIISAKGTLRVKEGGRESLNATVPDMQPGDQRGHIIADLFGGSNDNDNLIAQLSGINQGKYKSFEDSLRKLIDDHHRVDVSYTLIYDDNTKRPSDLIVFYTVDSARGRTMRFPNK